MNSLEDKIISAVLCWNDSKETDSPEEVSVLRHHVRTALEAEAMQPPTQRAQPYPPVTDAMVEAGILAAHGYTAPGKSRLFYRLVIEGALNAALQAAQEPVWMPIETAPKDGTAYDIWADGQRYTNMITCSYGGHHPAGGGTFIYRSHRVLRATHWMPQPDPPSAVHNAKVWPKNPKSQAIATTCEITVSRL